ncbi:response regulator [Caldimonas tepidiphila]|uniref:response regulator n=1 Tax=Caldimonas tepidiphila TaxID=2315841 RepID=UPI000E5A5AC8|nr:response regulator [Caldimonas tepidiphila]
MSLPPRALVVDDNALNSRLVAVLLQRLGWESETVGEGEQALQRLRRQAFDMVLLDLRMPCVNGEEVCRRIREELELRELPVIAYTAHSMPEERARILAAGFSGQLIKPISFGDVRELCEQFAPAQRAG